MVSSQLNGVGECFCILQKQPEHFDEKIDNDMIVKLITMEHFL
jgi:hypothetical protein